jgi:hypothetical protein
MHVVMMSGNNGNKRRGVCAYFLSGMVQSRLRKKVPRARVIN